MADSHAKALAPLPTEGSKITLSLWLKAGFQQYCTKYIIAEHHCAPPEDGKQWVAVRSSHQRSVERYVCCECGQQFRTIAQQPAPGVGSACHHR